MESGKHAGSFSFACEKVIAAPQEQMGGDARGGWRGAVGRAVDLHDLQVALLAPDSDFAADILQK